MSVTFKQYDKKWAKHKYPLNNKKGSTMSSSGCAPTSCASIIVNKYPNITPVQVADYSSSIGGATAGGATYHWAIPKIFKHYGMECIEVTKMSSVFSYMQKDCWAILLFRGGSKGGITWTKGGHYISATAIKISNGRHVLYMRDSGQRNHVGWYTYETQMKGLIKKAWIIKPIKKATPSPTTTPTPTAMPTNTAPTPVSVKTPNQKAIEGAVAYAKQIANNNTYGYKRYDSTDHMCPICHPKTKVKGFNCIGLVAACFAHGAGDKKILANCKANNGSALGNNATLTKVTLDSWRKKNGNSWIMITNGGKKNGADISTSKLKAGDVLIGYNSKGKYQHTMLYIGGGQIVDAVSSGGKSSQISIHNYSTRAKSLRITRAFRYTGVGKYGN